MTSQDSPALSTFTPPGPRRIPLDGGQLGLLHAALLESFTLDDLTQLLRMEFDVDLGAVVPIPGRTLDDITFDLVLWALHRDGVGLKGLLAAAQRQNPTAPKLVRLQLDWAEVTFDPPGCPYPGMRPFTAEDKARFFGRRAEVAQAVDSLRRHPFLAIIGPSGSGKSSLLAAGILPALQASPVFGLGDWQIKTMRPGARPMDAFLGLDLTAAGRLLLIVDQYEELFTTADPDQRKAFEQALAGFIQQPNHYLIVAARADFYAGMMASPLWPAIRDHRLEITPPRGNALREAIAFPARDVGVLIEPDLVERLLADAGEEPGVLPFVQETLVMLWSHADDLRIDLPAYTDLVGDQSGRSGLQVALARHADHVYNDILKDDAQRAIARRIFLRLIQFGEGRTDTRRQQTVDALRAGEADPAPFDSVLNALTANRLVTVSEEARRVDLSHEALIRGWPLLRGWIDQRRVAELTRRRLEEKAGERERLRGSDPNGGLLDAVELAEAEAWINGPDAAELGVSPALAALVADSRDAIDAEALRKEQDANRLRQRSNILAVALGVAVLAGMAALFFFFSARNALDNAQTQARRAEVALQEAVQRKTEAEEQRTRAEEQSRIAEEQRNAAQIASERARQESLAAAAARDEAEARRSDAERSSRRAEAETLAAIAQLQIQRRQGVGDQTLLLARDAVLRTWDSPERYVTTNADDALRAAVDASSWRANLPSARERHWGSVNNVAFSPDGRRIASTGADGTVRIWYTPDLRPLRLLSGHAGATVTVAFSPDGKLVAAGGVDGTVRLWNAYTGAPVRTIPAHTEGVTAVHFSPDGRLLLSAGRDGALRLWRLDNGVLQATFSGHTGGVNDAAFNRDGTLVASAGADGTVRLWQATNGVPVRTLEGHPGPVTSVAFSPDGVTLASAGQDRRVRQWDATTGQLLQTSELVAAPLPTVAYSPDGKHLLVGGTSRTLERWDAATLRLVGRYIAPKVTINAAQFSPGGVYVVGAGSDGALRLWDAAEATLRAASPGHSAAVSATAFGPNAQTLASADNNGTVLVWDMQTGKARRMAGSGDAVGATEETQSMPPINGLAFSPDGTLLAGAGDDNLIRVWDPATGHLSATLPGLAQPAMAVAFSPDGTLLAAAGLESHVLLWDVAATLGMSATATPSATGDITGDITATAPLTHAMRVIDTGEYQLRSLAFSADGSKLLTGGNEVIQQWDVRSGEQVTPTIEVGGKVIAVAYSPNAAIIAGADESGTVMLWNALTGESLRELTGQRRAVRSVAFSQDGATLIGASGDGFLHQWDTNTGLALSRRQGNEQSLTTAAFSPDGQVIAAGSNDGLLTLWNARTDAARRTLTGHRNIGDLAVTPDGQTLVSADGPTLSIALGRRSVRRWDAATGRELAKWFIAANGAKVSADGSIYLVAGNQVTLYDAVSGEKLRVIGTPSRAPYYKSATMSPDGTVVASITQSNTAELIDVGSGQVITQLAGAAGVNDVAFSPDSTRLAAVTGDGTLWLWDAQSGAPLTTTTPGSGGVASVRFSPDGGVLLTAGDNRLDLWSAATGERLRGIDSSVPLRRAMFSPDAALIATGDEDGTVLLWDAATLALRRTFDAHDGAATALAFTPDGATLVTGGADGRVLLWPVTVDSLLSEAARYIQRPVHTLTPQEQAELGVR